MAYVAITPALIGDVTRGMTQKRNAESATMSQTRDAVARCTTDEAFRSALLNHLWAPYEHLRRDTAQYSYKLSVNVITPGDLPTISLAYEDGPCFIQRDAYSTHKVTDFPLETTEAGRALIETHTMQQECYNRWEKVMDQVRAFLQNCKSLNEAVKLWPDVANHIPKEYMDRLNAKTARQKEADDKKNKALEALKAIDMDALKTSEVLARMARGQAGGTA